MGIALENVSFTYQEGTPLASTALSDVSLTIEDGSYTALIGHTGSGKSTILQLLNGLLVPVKGVCGFLIPSSPRLLKTKIFVKLENRLAWYFSLLKIRSLKKRF